MRRTAVATVAVLAALAGCALGGPGAAGGAVEYNLTNAETTPYTFSVGVVDGPIDSFEVRYTNGTTRTVPVAGPEGPGEPVTAVYDLRNVSAVSVAGRSERVSETVGPDESSPGEFEADDGATVVLVAGDEGRVRAVGVARCGDGKRMYYVDLLVGSYGPGVGLGCR